MKENKLKVLIKKPVKIVFNFTIDPSNTHRWIESITEETIQGKEIKLGTRYVNKDTNGNLNLYDVTKFEENKVFELKSFPPFYTVRYMYTEVSDDETELEYHEWTEYDKLSQPFEQSYLEKLKNIIESE